MAIRIEGLDAIHKALADNPAASRRAQRNFLFGGIRRTNRRVQVILKREVPKKTGALSRSIRVYTPKGGRPTMAIAANRQFVPLNRDERYLSKVIDDLPRLVGNEVNKLLIEKIRSLHND